MALIEYLQQPIVLAKTMRKAGVELLSRVDGLSPALALNDNASDWLMLDIGGLSLIRYGGQASPAPVFVNLSQHVARLPWATETLFQACRRTMDAARIQVVIEIDEALELGDAELLALVQRARTAGLLLAMDDHRGTEGCYHRSSLGCWDFVKVCSQQREAGAVCKDIQRLARCGTPIVAEAIETDENCRAVIAAGADYVQGWFTGRPAPVAKLVAAGAYRGYP